MGREGGRRRWAEGRGRWVVSGGTWAVGAGLVQHEWLDGMHRRTGKGVWDITALFASIGIIG